MKPNNSHEFAALIGLDWGDKSHAVALEPVGGSTETSTLEHSAESLHHWLDQLEQRFGARQWLSPLKPTRAQSSTPDGAALDHDLPRTSASASTLAQTAGNSCSTSSISRCPDLQGVCKATGQRLKADSSGCCHEAARCARFPKAERPRRTGTYSFE